MLESAIEDFPLWKQELVCVEATIFNNIAACCKKELNSKMEIEYTTKVIERCSFISDPNVILKAYLRRGLAYEQCEKYLQAKEDMLSVKQIQADNKQASQCLHRCQKAIKDIYGDKVPDVKKNELIKLATAASAQKSSPPKQVETAAPVETKKVAEKKETDKAEKNDEPKMTATEINLRLAVIKDEGNGFFKQKSFMMAGAKFTEGINLYKKNIDVCNGAKESITLVTNLYTNRALAWHNIDNQEDSFSDANFVLTNLDPKNTKALFRRAHCYKLKSQFALAVQDLELLCSIDAKNPVAKKDLVELKTKLRDEKTNKIQEVEVKSTPAYAATPVVTETAPPTEEAKAKKNVVNKTKLLDSDVIEKAAAQASQEASSIAMKSIPKTAAGFEKDFNQLKKDLNNVNQYLANLPVSTVEAIFKKSEVPAEIFSACLQAISLHGLGDKASVEKSGNFLTALGKASSFDMTLMFIDDSDKAVLSQVSKSLKQHGCKDTSAGFEKVYGSVY